MTDVLGVLCIIGLILAAYVLIDMRRIAREIVKIADDIEEGREDDGPHSTYNPM